MEQIDRDRRQEAGRKVLTDAGITDEKNIQSILASSPKKQPSITNREAPPRQPEAAGVPALPQNAPGPPQNPGRDLQQLLEQLRQDGEHIRQAGERMRREAARQRRELEAAAMQRRELEAARQRRELEAARQRRDLEAARQRRELEATRQRRERQRIFFERQRLEAEQQRTEAERRARNIEAFDPFAIGAPQHQPNPGAVHQQNVVINDGVARINGRVVNFQPGQVHAMNIQQDRVIVNGRVMQDRVIVNGHVMNQQPAQDEDRAVDVMGRAFREFGL